MDDAERTLLIQQCERRILNNSNNFAKLHRRVKRAEDRLAAAEQRATESEERAERLAEKLIEARAFVMKLERRRDPFASDINDYTHLIQTISDALAGRPDYVPKQRKASGNAPSNPAPATQPDERAAKERTVVEYAMAWRKARRTDHPGALHWRDTPDVRDAEVALIAAVDALDATDGAAKEGA